MGLAWAASVEQCQKARVRRAPNLSNLLCLRKVTVVSGKCLSFILFSVFVGHVIRQADRHIQ